MDFVWTIAALVAIAALVWFSRRASAAATQKFFDTIRLINEQEGTAFPIDQRGINLILSDGSLKASMIFDVTNRKICVFEHNLTNWRVENYSWIRSWRSDYTVTGAGNGKRYHHFIEFHVNDVNRPKIEVPCRNTAHQSEWASRLGVLMMPTR